MHSLIALKSPTLVVLSVNCKFTRIDSVPQARHSEAILIIGNKNCTFTKRLQVIYACCELISIVRPLVAELTTRVTLLLQLNGILLEWKIQQISQNAATPRPLSDRSVMRS